MSLPLVENAIRFDAFSKAALIATMKDKTELENPNSVQQMRDWLSSKGIDTESLDKKAIADLIKTVPTEVADVLALRQQLAKSSVKKYQVYSWVRKFDANGENALIDKRGHHKTDDEVDELERLRRENMRLKRQLQERDMTVELLKKKRELEGM